MWVDALGPTRGRWTCCKQVDLLQPATALLGVPAASSTIRLTSSHTHGRRSWTLECHSPHPEVCTCMCSTSQSCLDN